MASLRIGPARPIALLSMLAAVANVAGGCAAHPAVAARRAEPVIALRHNSADEQATRRQLERLLAQYDVSPWSFTDRIEIDDDAIPHSHPVLTLHTRHLLDDLLLLSTYVHEQSHRYFVAHRAATVAAIAELEAGYPDLPVGFPDGANDRESSYEHLGVIAFELDGLRRLVGELRARQVLEFWATDHYRVLYRIVLDHNRAIREVLKRHGLEPPARA